MTQQTFHQLGLSDNVIQAIQKKGFEVPTPVQAKTIPILLNNDCHIMAQAQTGTGKTAAFGLPLIDLIDAQSKFVQAVILVPTRELALQVSDEIQSLKGTKPLSIIPIYGGQSIEQQYRRLKKGGHIIVGSPGRVIDHLKRKTLNLSHIKHLVLDEADEMLNMGFIDDIEMIMSHTNKHKKILLFSATLPDRIRSLAKKYLPNYEHIQIQSNTITANLTEQIYFEVRGSDKFEVLCRIIDHEHSFYGLVFCRTKRDVDTISNQLIQRGYDAEPIHGDITQSQRERTLGRFKKKTITLLIATDVAARGIDVDNLTHVINYSLPQDPESYIHRIGRTGRAGQTGTAITLISPSEYRQLLFIQRLAKSTIKRSNIPKIDAIITTKRKKIAQDLQHVLDIPAQQSYLDWAKDLLENQAPVQTLAAVLTHCFEETLNEDQYNPIHDVKSKNVTLDQQGKTRLFVARGRKDGLTPKTLIDMIRDHISIRSHDIRRIQIMDSFSFVTLPFDQAEELVVSLKKNRQKPVITYAKAKK